MARLSQQTPSQKDPNSEAIQHILKLYQGDKKQAISYALSYLNRAEEAFQLVHVLCERKDWENAVLIAEKALQLSKDKLQGYKILKELTQEKWSHFEPTILQMLQRSHDTEALAEVYLFERRWEDAIQLAERSGVFARTVERIATTLVHSHPDWVLKTALRQSENWISHSQSKYYPVAARWLRLVREAHYQLKQIDKWNTYFEAVQQRYKRRTSLMNEIKKTIDL